jgi:hypothetical protein
VQFPLEVLGCTLPWSPLLFTFCRRPFREAAPPSTAGQLLLMTVVLAIGVPTCWLPPNGMTRYLVPLYPCIALVIGAAIQRLVDAAPDSQFGIGWRRYMLGCGVLVAVVAVALPATMLLRGHRAVEAFAEPPVTAILFCAAFLGLAWLVRKAALNAAFPRRAETLIVSLAAFMALFHAGPVQNLRNRICNDAEAEIAKLKAELPADAAIVSIDHAHAELPFFLQRPIKAIPAPAAASIPEGCYFAVMGRESDRPPLPFPYQEIRVIPFDRYRSDHPREVIVIARRVPAAATADRPTPAEPVGFGPAMRERVRFDGIPSAPSNASDVR